MLTNSTAIGAFAHTITACFVTAGIFVVAISAWQLRRGKADEVFRPSMKMALVTMLVASIGVVASGDLQARLMTKQRPMKTAAAEALWETSAPASFSLFIIGTLDVSEEVWSLRVPNRHLDGAVEGIDTSRPRERNCTGPATTAPTSRSPTGPSASWSGPARC